MTDNEEELHETIFKKLMDMKAIAEELTNLVPEDCKEKYIVLSMLYRALGKFSMMIGDYLIEKSVEKNILDSAVSDIPIHGEKHD